MATTNGAHDVKFYFDPVCPWAWRTSLWIREAAKVRSIRIEWRLFALDTANRAAGNPPREVHQQSLVPFRVMVQARRQHGPEVLDRLYLGFGRARHERKETINEVQVMERVLEEAGLSPDLIAAALADPTTEEEWQREHAEVAARGAFGVPTLLIDDAAPLYGPVIGNVPEGEAAGELWDHVLWLSRQPQFYELKRPR